MAGTKPGHDMLGLMARDGAPDSASALPGERLLTMREPGIRA
jgi:hypothetical protein